MFAFITDSRHAPTVQHTPLFAVASQKSGFDCGGNCDRRDRKSCIITSTILK